MAAGKLKNLIILILVLANVFLLALVIPARLSERQRRETADRELTELFADSGVTLPEGGVPDGVTIYPQEASTRPGDNLSAVTAVLGQQVVASESAYRTEYRSAQGEASLTADGAFSASVWRNGGDPLFPEIDPEEAVRCAIALGERDFVLEVLPYATMTQAVGSGDNTKKRRFFGI